MRAHAATKAQNHSGLSLGARFGVGRHPGIRTPAMTTAKSSPCALLLQAWMTSSSALTTLRSLSTPLWSRYPQLTARHIPHCIQIDCERSAARSQAARLRRCLAFGSLSLARAEADARACRSAIASLVSPART
eukprot:3940885-Rhodomonas_salina.2